MQNAYSRDKDFGAAIKENLDDDMKAVMKQGEETVRNAISELEKKIKQGEEQARRLIKEADKQLHERPWPIVTGVAVGALFLGFLMGASRRR